MYLAGTANGKKLLPSVRFLARSIAGSMNAAVSRMIARRVVMSARVKPCLVNLEQARTAVAKTVMKRIMGVGERDNASHAAETAATTM
jgi:hypothetical protein